MDIGTVVGLILALIGIVGSILLGGSLTAFYDLPSVFAVGFGVVGTTLMKCSMETVKSFLKTVMKAFFFSPADPKLTIEEISKLAETARRESIFALEKVPIEDAFLKKAMTLAADNRPPDVIQSILQMEIDSMSKRHKANYDMIDGIEKDGPAMGMLGTLIGLVIMLGNLQDQAAIGPAMAVALLTTFYGSMIANLFAAPIKTKIKTRSEAEIFKMNIIIAGTLGIVAGENPRLIVEKLNSFLPPSQRTEAEKKE